MSFRFINGQVPLLSWHLLYIFSLYHSFKRISSLVNCMAKLHWESKPRFTVAHVVRDQLIVTSHTNCDVTSCPVVMYRYQTPMGTNSGTKRQKLRWCQAIIWSNIRIWLIGHWRTNFSEISNIFSYKKMYLKMSSEKWRPFCLGLIVPKHM